jgi:hypothetical protein
MLNKLACLLVLVVMSASPVPAEKAATEEARPTGAARSPIGVFAVPRELLYLAKMKGFEVVHDYRFEESRDKNDELAAYLDAAHQLDLKAMVGFEREENYTVPKVVERVRRFRSHPAIWAWYLCDEPKTAMRDQVADIAAVIRREDPDHPLIIATDQASFAILADLVFAYTYPIKDQAFPHQDLGSEMRRIDQVAKAGTPFCVLVQTFNWNHYLSFDKKRQGNRYPTGEEMRFMAFHGVLKGARGVFFFSFQTLPIEHSNLSDVAALADELKVVREYLVGDQVDAKRFIEYPHAAAWRKEGGTLLLITNPSSQSVEATLNTGPWTLGDFKNPKAMIPSGKLTLKPWGVRLLLAKEKSVSLEGTQ